MVAVLALFLISSCVKNNEQLPIDEAKISSAIAMNTKEERRVTFRLLNAAEKAELWKRHLSECAKDNSLTTEQKVFILSLIPALNIERFTKPLKKGDKDSQLDAWKVQASLLFKEQDYEIDWLFQDFTNKKPVIRPLSEETKERLIAQWLKQGTLILDKSIQVETRRYPDCDCATGSYCSTNRLTNCLWLVYDCTSGSCTETYFGCSWFGLGSCNGKCGNGSYVWGCP